MNDKLGSLDQFLMRFQLTRPRVQETSDMKELSLNKSAKYSEKYCKTPSPVKDFDRKIKNFIGMPRLSCKPKAKIKKVSRFDPLGTYEKVREELM